MDQFRVYLKAELGKLQQRVDAERFLEAVPHYYLKQCGLESEVEALMAHLPSQERVNQLVDRLSDDALLNLTRYIDRNWRQNGVFERLSRSDDWHMSKVDVGQIRLGLAEQHFRHLWECCDYELPKIATCPEVLASLPYCNMKPGTTVDFPICLAKRVGDHYRIFDGDHRAIQMFINGETQIPLYWSEKHI